MNKVEAQELIINIVHARQVPEVEEKSPRALTDDEAKKWREAPASRSEAAFRKWQGSPQADVRCTAMKSRTEAD